jgi:hypothetical protein
MSIIDFIVVLRIFGRIKVAMAKMIPHNLPKTSRSNAEKILFDIFAKELSDDYIVFYSAWWQHKFKYIIQDREADFIIIHPNKGILILEAKGGQIRYDSINKTWYQNENRMKISPFQQVKNIKFAFLSFLSQYPEFVSKDFCIGQCISFTDIDSVESGLPSESPQEILILRPHLSDINQCISSIFNYYKAGAKKVGLGEQRIQKIIDLISPSTIFKKYMVNDIGEIQQEIFKLTKHQFDVLNSLYLHRQSVILGCAGSGKTQLAVEKAKRLCQHQIKTCVTCKSSYLSLYLTASLQDEIQNGYCLVYNYKDIGAKNFNVEFNCEAIIVDEGQDFCTEEIEQLKHLIQSDGIFYIFQDSNQNLSKKITSYALPVNPTVLDKNCRNTHQIFEYAKPFVSCLHPITSSLVKGKDVIQREYKETGEILKLIEQDIVCLVDEEKVSTTQIIILTDMYPLSKSILFDNLKLNQFELKQYSPNNIAPNVIQWSNIGIYKGLENDIVILCFEKQKTLIPSNWDIANRYTGTTRARSLLIIYKSPDPDIDF